MIHGPYNIKLIKGTLHEDLAQLRYLAEFFLEREMPQTNLVDKIKTHILCSKTFFLKSWRL